MKEVSRVKISMTYAEVQARNGNIWSGPIPRLQSNDKKIKHANTKDSKSLTLSYDDERNLSRL